MQTDFDLSGLYDKAPTQTHRVAYPRRIINPDFLENIAAGPAGNPRFPVIACDCHNRKQSGHVTNCLFCRRVLENSLCPDLPGVPWI